MIRNENRSLGSNFETVQFFGIVLLEYRCFSIHHKIPQGMWAPTGGKYLGHLSFNRNGFNIFYDVRRICTITYKYDYEINPALPAGDSCLHKWFWVILTMTRYSRLSVPFTDVSVRIITTYIIPQSIMCIYYCAIFHKLVTVVIWLTGIPVSVTGLYGIN